jgi:Zn-dependent peptidase ImmA (M78 family)
LPITAQENRWSTIPLFPEGVQKIKTLRSERTERQESEQIVRVKDEQINFEQTGPLKPDGANDNRSLQEIVKAKDIKALNKHLKQGISNYLKSDTYKNYLSFLSHFHHYSNTNNRLILGQRPDAQLIASAKKWKDQGRYINKGEKALYIYAPINVIKKDQSGNPILDEKGKEIKKTFFKLVPVFDATQTNGKELPKALNELNQDFENKETFVRVFKTFKEVSSASINFSKMNGDTKGYYQPETNQIVVAKGLGQEQTIKTLIHEITHAELHASSTSKFGSPQYSQNEFEAESVAYIVANHFGIDSSEYSFGYLSSWTNQGDDLQNFEVSLEKITNEANQLIEKIDKTLERVISLERIPENKFAERLVEAQTENQMEVSEPNPKVESRSMK